MKIINEIIKRFAISNAIKTRLFSLFLDCGMPTHTGWKREWQEQHSNSGIPVTPGQKGEHGVKLLINPPPPPPLLKQAIQSILLISWVEYPGYSPSFIL